MLALIGKSILVSLVLLIISCEHFDEITPRKYVGMVVGQSGSLKIEIAKSLLANPAESVSQAGALQLTPPSGLMPLKVDFGWVTRSGAIFIQNKEYGVTVLQEPIVENGSVKWTCVVHPAEAKPNLCGSDYQNSLLQNK
jgi:hypothetical protein